MGSGASWLPADLSTGLSVLCLQASISSLRGANSFCLATQIMPGRLDGDMSEQELNLVQFGAGKVVEPGSFILRVRTLAAVKCL